MMLTICFRNARIAAFLRTFRALCAVAGAYRAYYHTPHAGSDAINKELKSDGLISIHATEIEHEKTALLSGF